MGIFGTLLAPHLARCGGVGDDHDTTCAIFKVPASTPPFASEGRRGQGALHFCHRKKKKTEDVSVRPQIIQLLGAWNPPFPPNCHPLCPVTHVQITRMKNMMMPECCVHECCQVVGRRKLRVAMLCAHAHCRHLAPHHLAPHQSKATHEYHT